MARIVMRDAGDAKRLKRAVIAGVFIPSPEMDFTNDGEYVACEIYIVPVKTEPFRGQKNLRVDQMLNDFHFSHPFGECVTEEHSHCSSCESKGYAVKQF